MNIGELLERLESLKEGLDEQGIKVVDEVVSAVEAMVNRIMELEKKVKGAINALVSI